MEIYYTIVAFIFGITLGSFYNVVAYRLPLGQSLIKPRSHCPNCNHELTAIELIPILSFLIQGGKCKNCKKKISWFYPIFEFSTGLLFALSYIAFGASLNLVIALVLVSVLLINIISDFQKMVIIDSTVVIGIIVIAITVFFKSGLGLDFEFLTDSVLGNVSLLSATFNGIVGFLLMYGIKILGTLAFKKEAMGDGDIKLMFLISFVLGFRLAIVVIFLSAFIALPYSLVELSKKNKKKVEDVPEGSIPFGPFLAVATLIIFFITTDFATVINFIS